jgi:hypothetical protein
MRRSMLVATLIALAMFAGACGRLNDNGSGGGNGAGSGGIEHPTGAGDLILQVGVSGGFVAVSTTLTQFPGFSLYGDGTLITQGAQTEIYPGPALPAMIQTHVTEDGIQAILQAAQTAGLFGADTSYGYNCIADVGTTTFILNAEGSTHTIDAYALGIDEGSCQGADETARHALAAFDAKLGDLRSWLPAGSVGEDATYTFSEIRIYVQPYAGQDPNMQQEPISWPLSPGLGSFGEQMNNQALQDARCGVVGGDDLTTLMPDLQRANQLTPWSSDGVDYSLLLRPLLPDEHTC